jgi:hypothetical protein
MCRHRPVCFVTVAVRVASTENNDIMNFINQETLKELRIRKF